MIQLKIVFQPTVDGSCCEPFCGLVFLGRGNLQFSGKWGKVTAGDLLVASRARIIIHFSSYISDQIRDCSLQLRAT